MHLPSHRSILRLIAVAVVSTGTTGVTPWVPATAAAAPLKPRAPGERQPRITDFWKRETPATVQKRERRFRRAMTLIRQGVTSGAQPRVIIRQSVLVGHAILATLALRHPKEARFWYWYGYASKLLGKVSLTMGAWKRVWQLEPNHWDTSSMAFELGILYARRGRYAESVAVYRKGMPAALHLTTRGIMASNCAESLLALGKLRAAVAMYRRSLRLRPLGNDAAWWGLMVAYDRLGLTWAAEQARQEALTLDPNLRGLLGTNVFFVPAGDVHYYLALAHEGQGRVRQAREEWRRYLAARPQTRWKRRVQLHQARLRQAMARWKPQVYLLGVRPFSQGRAAASLVAPVLACYRQRARQLKTVPEGRLPLFLTLRKERVTGLAFGWSARPLADAALRRCVRRRLQNRRLMGANHARIVAVFQLERGP